MGHFVRGQLAQFIIDQGQEFLGGLGVALRNRVQNARDLAHTPAYTRNRSKKEV